MTKREEYINWLSEVKENEHGEIILSGQAVKDIVELLSLEEEPHKGSGINKYVMDDDFDTLEEVAKAYEQGKKDAGLNWKNILVISFITALVSFLVHLFKL